MIAIEAHKPILISSTILDPISLQFLHNISLENVNCKAVVNHINVVLLLNII